MTDIAAEYEPVLEFWFEALTPAQWWKKDAELDELIAHRYGDLHNRAAAGELFRWRHEPRGRLAEIIVLDQFSRNIYRDTARAFTWDGMALVLAQEAVAHHADQALSPTERSFIYLPYMHSESLAIHDMAVILFKANGLEQNLDFEMRHRNIIARFGRYPHRNDLLGRESTAEEKQFLTQPGSSF